MSSSPVSAPFLPPRETTIFLAVVIAGWIVGTKLSTPKQPALYTPAGDREIIPDTMGYRKIARHCVARNMGVPENDVEIRRGPSFVDFSGSAVTEANAFIQDGDRQIALSAAATEAQPNSVNVSNPLQASLELKITETAREGEDIVGQTFRQLILGGKNLFAAYKTVYRRAPQDISLADGMMKAVSINVSMLETTEEARSRLKIARCLLQKKF